MKKFTLKPRGLYFGKPYLEKGTWLTESWGGKELFLVSHWNWGLGIIYGDFETVEKYDPENQDHVAKLRTGGNWRCSN